MFNHIINALISQNSQLFNTDKVEDCIVAQIECNGATFSYDTSAPKYSKEPNDWKNQSNELENILIVLESPHYNEYNKNRQPLRPAMGTTGKKLEDNLIDIMNRNTDLTTSLDNAKYNLWLVNAIQYQCSFGIRPMQVELKNTIFRILWNSLQDDFKERIKKINPKVIINLCTGGKQELKKYIKNSKYSAEPALNILVHNAIKEINQPPANFSYFYGIHPSSRAFSKSDFIKS